MLPAIANWLVKDVVTETAKKKVGEAIAGAITGSVSEIWSAFTNRVTDCSVASSWRADGIVREIGGVQILWAGKKLQLISSVGVKEVVLQISGKQGVFTGGTARVPVCGRFLIRYEGELLIVHLHDKFGMKKLQAFSPSSEKMKSDGNGDMTLTSGPESAISATARRGKGHIAAQFLLECLSTCRDSDREHIILYTSSDIGWKHAGVLRIRPLTSIAMSDTVRQEFIEDAHRWNDRADWYHERGIPYQRVYILTGPAGTGKSSLISALAGSLPGFDLRLLSLSGMDDEKLRSHFGSDVQRSVVAIEDFDSVSAVQIRDAMKPETEESDEPESAEPKHDTKGTSGKPKRVKTPLTLSGILNAINGAVPNDQTIIVLTTNTLSDIDPALLRKGRVDKIIHVGPLGHKEVVDYIKIRCPGVTIPDVTFAEIKGCDIQDLYVNAHSEEEFVANIPTVPEIVIESPEYAAAGRIEACHTALETARRMLGGVSVFGSMCVRIDTAITALETALDWGDSVPLAMIDEYDGLVAEAQRAVAQFTSNA